MPERALTADVDALLAAVTPRTRIVYIANPNNPTGTYMPQEEIERLRGALPEDVLLVIDSAYAEYVTRNDYSAGETLVERGHNTVMTRTFSKIYGLGGVRLGWAYCPEPVAAVLQSHPLALQCQRPGAGRRDRSRPGHRLPRPVARPQRGMAPLDLRAHSRRPGFR